jgi:hypothetical protein
MHLVIDFSLDFQSILPPASSKEPVAGLSEIMPSQALNSVSSERERRAKLVDGAQPSAVEIVKFESFEDSFPGPGWTILDESEDGFDRSWGADDYFPASGNLSAWIASSGADSLDPEFSGYPDDLDSWMYYGPIDLSEAIDFYTYFSLAFVSRSGDVYLYLVVSHDGEWYGAWYWTGNFGPDYHVWRVSLDDFVGFDDVHVAWVFQSMREAPSEYFKGPFIDDLYVIRRTTAPPASANYLPFVSKRVSDN